MSGARGRGAAPREERLSGGKPREVRLIGGQWKRSKLPVLDRPGLRPTPDRVRETLFNWLGQDLTGWCVLDAYAGSGALGFEAASRGAAEVVLLDRDASIVRTLRAQADRLGATQLAIECADAPAWMARCAPRRFDLVLLDPPFDAAIADASAAAAAPLLVDDGLLYVESPAPLAHAPPGCGALRASQAGAVHFSLWRRGYTSPPPSRGNAT